MAFLFIFLNLQTQAESWPHQGYDLRLVSCGWNFPQPTLTHVERLGGTALYCVSYAACDIDVLLQACCTLWLHV